MSTLIVQGVLIALALTVAGSLSSLAAWAVRNRYVEAWFVFLPAILINLVWLYQVRWSKFSLVQSSVMLNVFLTGSVMVMYAVMGEPFTVTKTVGAILLIIALVLTSL